MKTFSSSELYHTGLVKTILALLIVSDDSKLDKDSPIALGSYLLWSYTNRSSDAPSSSDNWAIIGVNEILMKSYIVPSGSLCEDDTQMW